MHGPRTCW